MNIIPKKFLVIELLSILSDYTDKDHTLSSKEIYDIVRQRDRFEVDYKTIRRTLCELYEYSYPVCCCESVRLKNSDEMINVCKDWFFDHSFDTSELKIIIDALMFSKYMSENIRDELISKIEKLSSTYFKSNVSHIKKLNYNHVKNKQLFYTLEILDEAITEKKKVEFQYCEYGTDKKLHPRKRSDGSVRIYVANPYYIVPANQNYYLICNYEKFDDYSYYRIDRIINIKKLDYSAKPMSSVKGLENALNLPQHLAEHIYMFSGECSNVEMIIQRRILSDIFDWFGNDIRFSDETEDSVRVHVKVNDTAMLKWAMQYGLYVEIIKPDHLRNAVIDQIEQMRNKYLK